MVFFFCGYEKTVPNHAIGPSVRDYYIFHIIHKGKGIVRSNAKEYSHREGTGFILYPEVVSYYASDGKDPWEYSWVAVKGTGIEKILSSTSLSPLQCQFNHRSFDFFKFFSAEHAGSIEFDTAAVLTLKSSLLSFFAHLVNLNGNAHGHKIEKGMEPVYIQAVENIIHTNFHNKITIEAISASIGLNISYLGELFKKEKGITMKEYLTKTRLERSCELLINTSHTIGDIARSVGYTDPLQFSKMFKKHKSVSPAKYRKENSF
jgi:AraC-like DNA-binding protein